MVDLGGRIGGLDGMRGLACLCVIGAHTTTHFAPTTTPGGVAQLLAQGLVVFFTLSGFLIFLPFARDVLSGERRVNVRRYAKRRLLRIFPAYVVIFFIVNFLLRAVYVGNTVESSAPNSDAGTGMITDPARLLAHLTLTQSLFPSQIQTGINPAWSLTVELAYYIALPLLSIPLVHLVLRRGDRLRLVLIPGLVLLVVGLAGKTWATILDARYPDVDPFILEFGSNWVSVLSASLLFLADNFAPGLLVAVAYLAMRQGRWEWLTTRRVLWFGWPAFAISGALALVAHVVAPRFMSTFVAFAAAALLLMVVEPTARNRPSRLVSVADFRPARYVGEISLSVYLWHYPVIILLSRVDVGIRDSWTGLVWSFVLVSAISLLLGAIFHRWVEGPGQKLSWTSFRSTIAGKRRSRHNPPIQPAVAGEL